MLPYASIPGAFFPTPSTAQANSALAMQYQLLVSERLDPALLQKRQFTQFRAVLEHAIKTVPYYRKSLGKLVIPEEINLNFLQQLPILTREKIYYSLLMLTKLHGSNLLLSMKYHSSQLYVKNLKNLILTI